MVIYRENKKQGISNSQALEAVREFFAAYDYAGRRLLMLVPDNTRSGPIGDVFQMIFDCIGEQAAALDILVSLGTHQPMSEEQICQRLAISVEERHTKYGKVKFFNHEWEKPETFTNLGKISAEEIGEISGGLFYEEVPIAINKMIFDYDEIFILGPVFPHEVVGFSGGHKYIFPGIAADEIIHFFHWLGAVITNPKINGSKWTPTRAVVERAAEFIDMPRKLFAVVAANNQFNGIYIGEVKETWEKAADMSNQVHITYVDRTYHTVLGITPAMYDDMWVGGKVMYKLEPILADGATLIVYAPHITEVSYTHGKALDKIGYHTRDYFLNRTDEFPDIGRGVIAHSTHVKGIGTYKDGVETPRVKVVLATGIPKERCEKINLGYMDPAEINIADYEGREDEGVLVVHHAGEQLYRLSSGKIPDIDTL
jgi:nickel-dependent lactate racemase